MRAMATEVYGEPLVELDVPEPTMLPGQALLEVLTAGVCYSDVKTSRGLMGFSDTLPLPHVGGHEIYGRVIRTDPPGLVADGTTAIVYQYQGCGICPACRRGDEPLCRNLVEWIGFTDPGGFTERIAVPVDRLIRVPASIDPTLAAPMSCAMGTAYRAVVTRGGVRAGTTVGILGLGGVGIHAAQIANVAGGRVVGFDVHDETLAAARDLGVDARRSDDDDAMLAEVQDLTDGEGLDVVIDVVGREATFALCDRLARQGGRIISVGYFPTADASIPTARLALGEMELMGSRYAHRGEMDQVVALVERGLVRPVVGLVRPMAQVNDVFAALEAGNIVGRAVLDVAGVTR
jgi:D-arabinose 1-dehydrogenase-like Zn-dependent alcohol dehydrogenase